MKSKITKLYLLIFMSMVSFISNAQVADPDGSDDPPATSINKYVIFLAIVGIIFTFSFLTKKLSVKNK